MWGWNWKFQELVCRNLASGCCSCAPKIVITLVIEYCSFYFYSGVFSCSSVECICVQLIQFFKVVSNESALNWFVDWTLHFRVKVWKIHNVTIGKGDEGRKSSRMEADIQKNVIFTETHTGPRFEMKILITANKSKTKTSCRLMKWFCYTIDNPIQWGRLEERYSRYPMWLNQLSIGKLSLAKFTIRVNYGQLTISKPVTKLIKLSRSSVLKPSFFWIFIPFTSLVGSSFCSIKGLI